MSRQQEFTRALLNPAHPVPEGLEDGATRPAGRRFNVYRNNVAVSLTEALHLGFPVVARLLGRENMDGVAGLFLRAHPPSSPLMMHYGAAFPAFLRQLDQLSHLGYLPDVARLELALRRSYHAADTTPIDPQHLARIAPATLMESRLRLAPAVEVLSSPWPIHSIWRFNTQEGAPKPRPGGEEVLITRPDFDPIPHLLPAGGAAWITALRAGEALAAATEIAAGTTPDFDLSATLALLIEGAALMDLSQQDFL